jgi:DNA-binding GntR family transcriptional regulator
MTALKLPQRLSAELCRLAQQGHTTTDGILIKPAPSHEKLAAIVGAEREAVTRALLALAADGLIRSGRRQVLVLDIARLSAMAEQDLGQTATKFVDWTV